MLQRLLVLGFPSLIPHHPLLSAWTVALRSAASVQGASCLLWGQERGCCPFPQQDTAAGLSQTLRPNGKTDTSSMSHFWSTRELSWAQHAHPGCHTAALGPAGTSLKEDEGDRWHWGLGSALPWILALVVSPSSGDSQVHPFLAPPNPSSGLPEPAVPAGCVVT